MKKYVICKTCGYIEEADKVRDVCPTCGSPAGAFEPYMQKMKKYVICKTCGYIVEAGKIHDVCPACGAPAGAFEPYKSNMKKKREKILSLHMHPIILHFPQAVVVFSLLFIVASIFLTGPAYDVFIMGAKINTILLPLCVVGGLLTGIIDGKIRFKSATTPLLKNKIILSVLFLITSLAAALIIVLVPITTTVLLILALISLISTVVAIILGRMGSGLVNAAYPG